LGEDRYQLQLKKKEKSGKDIEKNHKNENLILELFEASKQIIASEHNVPSCLTILLLLVAFSMPTLQED
jgi:hypothetical protein